MKYLQLVITFLTISISLTVQAESPAMTTAWKNTQLVQDACVKMAEKSMKLSNFTEDFSSSDFSVYGAKQGYKGFIRCMPSKGMIFVAVAGADGDLTNSFIDLLLNNYREDLNELH